MTADSESGKVITFYSYKGGTGRSMALANTACLLARGSEEGGGVLMVDWDLDAPGLHEYFRSRFQRQFAGTQEPDRELERRPGVIDLFRSFDETLKEIPSGRPQTRDEARKLVRKIDPLEYVLGTDVPGLHLLKAGRFDAGYSAGVSTFPWEGLYQRSPWLVWAFAERLTERYRYVLVDSRTGLNDISGICTMLLPEKLVTVFTPNRQSLDGVYDLIRRATNYRRQSPDLRPLVAFPLPSRIDPQRRELRRDWRYGDPDRKIAGFQPAFEQLFREVYDLETCSLEEYFREVQIQHTSDFAYGEEVAVLTEWGTDRFDLTRSYEKLVEALVHSRTPWALSQGPDLDPAQEMARAAEAAFSRFSPEQQEAARRLFTRLVHLAPPGEGGRDTAIAVPAVQLAGSNPAFDALLTEHVVENDAKGLVELVDKSLIETWPRFGKWLQEDREFLLWRQGLRSAMIAAGPSREGLLTGKALEEARRWREARGEELNSGELGYISASESNLNRRVFLQAIAGVLATLTISGASIWGRRLYQTNLYESLLGSWGLPADLYERQGQLRTLTLPLAVNRVDWLAGNLERLTLVGSRVESLEGLPDSLRSLEITGTTLASLKGLPAALGSLEVEVADQLSLSELPAALESLSLSQGSLQEPRGLPENLRRLALQAPLRHLAGLPRSIEDLSLTGAQVRDLNGVPPRLKSLELSGTSLASLDGLPASVEMLVLVDNLRLREGELPKGLRSLRLESNPLYEPTVLPEGLTALVISFQWSAPLPQKLEALSLLHQPASLYGLTWPKSLKRLQVPIYEFYLNEVPFSLQALTLMATPDANTVSLKSLETFLPMLQELDLGRLEPRNVEGFPGNLQKLRIRVRSDRDLPSLPSTLQDLDLAGSQITRLPKLPPGLRRLSVQGTVISYLDSLPTTLEALDISGTRINSLESLPPRLKKLTLTTGQVSSLKGLPKTVEELAFLDEVGGPVKKLR